MSAPVEKHSTNLTIDEVKETNYEHTCIIETIEEPMFIECMDCCKKLAMGEHVMHLVCSCKDIQIKKKGCIMCKLIAIQIDAYKEKIDHILYNLGDCIKNGYYCEPALISDLHSITFEMRKAKMMLNKKQ